MATLSCFCWRKRGVGRTSRVQKSGFSSQWPRVERERLRQKKRRGEPRKEEGKRPGTLGVVREREIPKKQQAEQRWGVFWGRQQVWGKGPPKRGLSSKEPGCGRFLERCGEDDEVVKRAKGRASESRKKADQFLISSMRCDRRKKEKVGCRRRFKEPGKGAIMRLGKGDWGARKRIREGGGVVFGGGTAHKKQTLGFCGFRGSGEREELKRRKKNRRDLEFKKEE